MKSLKSTFLNRARNTKKRGNKRRHTRPTLKGGIAKIPSPTLNTRTRVIPVHPRLPTRRRELVGEESRVSERELVFWELLDEKSYQFRTKKVSLDI